MAFDDDLLPRGTRFGGWMFTTTDGSQNTDNAIMTPQAATLKCDLISFSMFFWTASAMNLTQMIYRLRLNGVDVFVIQWPLATQSFATYNSMEGQKGVDGQVWSFRWEPGAAGAPPSYRGAIRAEFQQL